MGSTRAIVVILGKFHGHGIGWWSVLQRHEDVGAGSQILIDRIQLSFAGGGEGDGDGIVFPTLAFPTMYGIHRDARDMPLDDGVHG